MTSSSDRPEALYADRLDGRLRLQSSLIDAAIPDYDREFLEANDFYAYVCGELDERGAQLAELQDQHGYYYARAVFGCTLERYALLELEEEIAEVEHEIDDLRYQLDHADEDLNRTGDRWWRETTRRDRLHRERAAGPRHVVAAILTHSRGHAPRRGSNGRTRGSRRCGSRTGPDDPDGVSDDVEATA